LLLIDHLLLYLGVFSSLLWLFTIGSKTAALVTCTSVVEFFPVVLVFCCVGLLSDYRQDYIKSFGQILIK